MRVFAAVAVAAVLAASAGCARNAKPVPRAAAPMNVILLTVDSLRRDHLHCYGYSRETSPAIDELASEGVMFENMFAQSAWTSPGLVSIFTSLFPPVHGVEMRKLILNPAIKTPMERLRQAGWRVYGFAYDEENYANLGFEGYADRNLTKFLDEHSSERFLIWHHVRGPHLPYDPEPEFRIFHTPGAPSAATEKMAAVMKKHYIVKGEMEFAPGDRPAIVDLYDAEVLKQDREIRAIVEKLKALGVWDRTIFVLTSDHGEELLDHGFLGHASTTRASSLYDELLKVPLIIRVPGFVPGAKRIAATARQVDIMPTVMELLGVEGGYDSQGRSLVRFMNGDTAGGDAPVFAQTTPCGWQCSEEGKRESIRCFRDNLGKLIHRTSPSGDSFEFYDLVADPGESLNLAAERPAAMHRYLETLGAWELESKFLQSSLGRPTEYINTRQSPR